MSGRDRGRKAKIHMEKPDLPPFLQRIREQMVAKEASERKETAERNRKIRGSRPDDPNEDPTVVKLGEDDLTEEEYKKLKKELETNYKLENEADHSKRIELDVDDLIKSRTSAKETSRSVGSSSGGGSRINKSSDRRQASQVKEKPVEKTKTLSYGDSSDDNDD